MKKLALDIETLCVESFSISAGPESARGTVRGHSGNMFCLPDDTKSKFWSCVCTPSGQYTCAC